MIITCPACKEQLQDSMIRCVCGYEYDMFLDYDQSSDLSVSDIHPGNLIIKDTSTDYEIIIPPKQNGLTYIDNVLYVIACSVMEILSIISYVTKRKVLNLPETETELLFIIGVSFLCGSLSIYTLLWNHVGKVHIIMTRGTLIIKEDLYGYGRKKVYDLSRMRNLCVRSGSISFDYDAEKFRFGHSITDGEAQFIVNELKKRNPFRVG